MEYNLVDIHFHSNLSYDAYENNSDCIKYDLNTIFQDSKVKMVCITDHNVFDYSKFLNNSATLEKKGIKVLPGMELTIDGVHWIIIIDDEKIKEGKIGENFSKELLLKIEIDINNYNINDLMKKQYKVADVIQLLDHFGINYVAIPHLDKDKGIFQHGKIEPKKIEVFLNYIRDNIVYGFETKYHDQFFIKKIENINKNIKILNENNNEKIECLYNQIKSITSARKISSAFIYGSDYHGKSGIKYSDLEDTLFYIKSECSFQGLRLSLLDYESRIFSHEKYEKYKKETNKILEEIEININGIKEKIKLGDGLNSIVGSRGTGKSYLLQCLLGDDENYKESDIYNQIKIEKVKLKNEDYKKFLDQQLDVDHISQKNSGRTNSNNIFDLLSEAPYDTEKFISKIRTLNTTIKKDYKIGNYFKKVNECFNSYITLNNKKIQTFDYGFLSTYNTFYSTSGETFRIVKLFDNYIIFCEDHVKKCTLENEKLENFNKLIDDFKIHIEFVKKVPKYEFNDFNKLEYEIETLKNANNKKIHTNNRNISRINKTKTFIEKVKEKISKDISNEAQYYNNGFKNLSLRIKQLIELMSDSLDKSNDIKKINEELIIDKEDIIINKNNISINLSIEYILNVCDKKVINLRECFKNYTFVSDSLKYVDLFDGFGEKYIYNIYPNKDGRITRGEYNGYDIYPPKIIPIITIEYNGEKKDISKLSPGEKADILLDLILDSNSNKILIIDQPEDDLDNETIFKKVVSKLRNIKMRRQVIIISHNANLVINGDSDKILICIKENNKYRVINDSMESLKKYNYSSINTSLIEDTILNISTHILDGGKEALSKRVKKIGYKDMFLEEGNDESSV